MWAGVNNDKFVRTYGKKFLAGDKSFYFQGTNFYWLGPASAGVLSDSEVEGVIHDHAANGLRVIRMWGFGHGWDDMTVDFKGTWTLKDTAFRRLDWVIAMAKKYGVRVIFPFVNYENDLTGIKFYVDNILGKDKDKEFFFGSSQVWWRYEEFVKNVVFHWNPFTGLMYRDDPTIFAWELMNEPHTADSFESKPSWPYQFGDNGVMIGRGQLAGRLVTQWLCRAATLVKSLDKNHMVTTGEEGYRTNGPYLKLEHNWLNNGLKGVDFESNIKCVDIDYMTIHVYPDNWEVPYWNYQYVIDNFMADRANLAHAFNKPVVMEEYGCCKQSDYVGKRGQLFQAMHAAVDKLDIAGCMVWQVVPWSSLKRDSNYDFTYGDDGGWEIKQNAIKMNSKW